MNSLRNHVRCKKKINYSFNKKKQVIKPPSLLLLPPQKSYMGQEALHTITGPLDEQKLRSESGITITNKNRIFIRNVEWFSSLPTKDTFDHWVKTENFKYLDRYGIIKTSDICESAVRAGNLKIFKRYYSNIKNEPLVCSNLYQHCWNLICCYGRDHQKITMTELEQNIHMQILMWMSNLDHNIRGNEYGMLYDACESNCFVLLQWLDKNCSINHVNIISFSKKFFDLALVNNNPEIFRWFLNHGYQPPPQLVVNIIQHQNHTFRDFIIKCDLNEYTCSKLAEKGEFDLLKLLVSENQGYLNTRVMVCAAKNGHYDMVLWLSQKNIVPDFKVFNAALLGGNVKILKWLQDQGVMMKYLGPFSDKNKEPKFLRHIPLKYSLLEWIKTNNIIKLLPRQKKYLSLVNRSIELLEDFLYPDVIQTIKNVL